MIKKGDVCMVEWCGSGGKSCGRKRLGKESPIRRLSGGRESRYT